jgi:acyl carrier protein
MGDGIELQVRSILAKHLGLEISEIQPEAHILDDLGADSLDVVEMVMALETAFDIEVPDAEVEAMRTIADVERFVASAVAA